MLFFSETIQLNCNEKLCVTKCCEKNHVVSNDSCVPQLDKSELDYLKPHFENVSNFPFIEFISKTCDEVSLDDTHFVILNNGSVYAENYAELFNRSDYCIDYLRNIGKWQVHFCYTDVDEDDADQKMHMICIKGKFLHK